ncbi:MAG: hypothetical protein JXQ75_02815 [Phycisphaerae bacterium]|nr:hypothetical protein [Phycisphaerae bacterium]
MKILKTSAGHTSAQDTARRGPCGADISDVVSIATYYKTETVYAPTAWRRHPLARADLLVAAAIVLAALLVRWPFIARGETLLHSDEAIVGLMAQDIAAGERFPVYFYGQRYMGALEAYVIAALLPLFDKPIHALRFGPTCFFALLVAVQYLMLTRWFGRRGGLAGAAVLLAGSPMFTQWSISARGGYIEILLWGSALIWAYSEWFVPGSTSHRSQAADRQPPRPPFHPSRSRLGRVQSLILHPPPSVRRFLLGGLIGSGLWINPSIVLFVVPIVAHALMNRPLAAVLASPGLGAKLKRATGLAGRTSLLLVAILAAVVLNATWAVWVEQGKVHNMLLLGLLPQTIAIGLLGTAAAGLLVLAVSKTHVVSTARSLLLRANGALILGTLAGAAPAALYVFQSAVGVRSMDPSLPLGFRPIWLAGETLNYLVHGLPLLFCADARPFLQLVSVGRDTAVLPLDIITSSAAVAASWLALGVMTTSLLLLSVSYRREVSKLLNLQPANYSPAVLLMLGIATTLAMYVMGGCTLDFTTIRYLVPLWAFVPGLLAAVFVGQRFRLAARVAPLCICIAYAVGQYAMFQQLGNPHPLRPLATAITSRGIDPAIAEPLDAHLLSYLTQQRCRTAEFESFWPRLAHFRPAVEADRPANYIVQTREIDRTQDWIAGGWPGEPPPETKRFLWPRLRRALIADPDLLLRRESLGDGYERIRLRRPLPERRGP